MLAHYQLPRGAKLLKQNGVSMVATRSNQMIGETTKVSFFDRPNVEKGVIQVGQGIPFGIESVNNPAVGIGGE